MAWALRNGVAVPIRLAIPLCNADRLRPLIDRTPGHRNSRRRSERGSREPNDKVSHDGSRGVVLPDPLAKGFVNPSLPSATGHLEVIDHVAGKADGC